ncbi:TonB-dependent receptor [Pseudomonas sp. DB1]|uniref:TonB-dependent receptor n=1 Tax=Metapseudomonas boanensis TaxID=2822138 RepID=A0ABS5XP52_9GAMM|nr:TonB-dependent receptor [Pseudomonas boanensis]
MAVGGRFAGTEQIQVRAVEHQDSAGHPEVLRFLLGPAERARSVTLKMYELVNPVNRKTLLNPGKCAVIGRLAAFWPAAIDHAWPSPVREGPLQGAAALSLAFRQSSRFSPGLIPLVPHLSRADPSSMTSMPMASNVDRRTVGGRISATLKWTDSARDFRQTLGKMRMPNPTADDTRAETLPSRFMRYEHDLVDRPTTLYAGLGHTQRFPDYWELFSPSQRPAGPLNAFDGVEPEKTTQLDFGIQYAGAGLEAWASGYVGQVRDYILFTYTPSMMGAAWRAESIDGRIMGGELGLAYSIDRNWKADAALAYAWGKIDFSF